MAGQTPIQGQRVAVRSDQHTAMKGRKSALRMLKNSSKGGGRKKSKRVNNPRY